jgi:hypothetical protein
MSIAAVGASTETPAPSFWTRARNLLPQGVQLTDEAWQGRHRFIQAALWVQVPILIAVGLARGFSPVHTLLEVLPLAAFGIFAFSSQSRGIKAITISTGLLFSEAILVHFTGGLIEAHFAFFVILPLIALYQDLRAFFIALGFVVIHHSVMTILFPTSVFNNHYEQAKPILWAGIHAGFVLALVGVMMVFWRFAEKSQIELAKAAAELADTTRNVEEVGDQLARSADTQALSVEMINESLADLQTRVQQTAASNGDSEVVSSISQIVEAVRMISDLTDEHSRNSERAAEATKALNAQATYLSSLVMPVRQP